MAPTVPILRLVYLFFNIYDTRKVLKAPAPSARNGGVPSSKAMTQRKRDMKGVMTIWIVWSCMMMYEIMADVLTDRSHPDNGIIPVFLLYSIFTRAYGSEPIYLRVIRPWMKLLEKSIEADFLDARIFQPIRIVHAWCDELTFRWESSADKVLQTVHTSKHSNLTASTGIAQDSIDVFGSHQIWYPPPPAYKEEDLSQVRPSQLPLRSLSPSTRNPDEGRVARSLSPVQAQTPVHGFPIVAPVPKSSSNVTNIYNTSNSGQSDDNDVDNTETRPGFHRSPPPSRESMNPDSVVRSNGKDPTRGVQLEEKTNYDRGGRGWMGFGDPKEGGGDGEWDGMNIDEKLDRVNTTGAEEMDEDSHAGDMTPTTPTIKINGMTMDSDAELEDALRPGRRTAYNLTLNEASSVATLDARKNTLSLKVDTASPPQSACRRLVGRVFAPRELPSLIEAAFLSKDECDTIRGLLGADAQSFIDVIDEALDRADLSPWARKKCLKSLYRTCGHHAFLPRALKVPVCYDRTGVALYRGGFADVWKGEHCGRDVAVKVIRVYSNSDLQRIVGRFCKEVVTWKTLRHPNILPLIGVTMSEAQFAMVSDWMANGNINDFVKAHMNVNRLELLGGVARGLIYIHTQGMIHGDLKGANILIDQTGHARLADFGLLTIISDPINLLSSSSYTQGGTARWMSPELIAPQRFGLKSSRPTKPSDCYAFGMVIYETISGNLPFHKHTDLTVFMKVVEGELPPRGVNFTKRLWEMLELCWTPQPDDRPSIEDVLRCLEMASDLSEPPSPGVGDGMDEDDDDWDPTTSSPDVPNRTSGVTDEGTYRDPLVVSKVIGDAGRPGLDIRTPDSCQSSNTQGHAPQVRPSHEALFILLQACSSSLENRPTTSQENPQEAPTTS